MTLKCLGAILLTLGLLTIATQIAAWAMLSNFLDRVASGLWGGVVISTAGILAILNKSAFRVVTALSVLCAMAIISLHTWALVRVMEESEILAPSKALDWIYIWGRMGNCSQICTIKIGFCPVMIFLGLLVLIFGGGLLFQEVKRGLPWRQKPPRELNPKTDLNLNLTYPQSQTPQAPQAPQSPKSEPEMAVQEPPRTSGPRPFLSTLI